MENKSGLKKNLIYNVTYQILVIILPLITAPYVTRVLGSNNLGIYSSTQASAHYFLLFAMLGVNNYGNRFIAQVRDDRGKMSKAFWEIYTFQFCTAVFSTVVFWLFVLLLFGENRLIYIMQSFYVMSGLIDVNWCCFGLEKFRLSTVRSTIVRILSAAAIYIFVRSKNDLWVYTFIASISFIISAVTVWPFVLRHVDFVKPTWEGIKTHIKPILVLFWPIVAVSIYNVMDRLMLSWLSTNHEVAFYTYAERIVTIPTTLILALDNVVMPRMSNLFASKNEKLTKNLMDYVMLFAMFMAAAMGFGMAGIADVFAPWFYGDDFARCGLFIILLSPVIIIKGWAGALRTQFIIPSGRDNVYVISLTAGAAVNIVLNLLLIPQLNGIGAIIGTIAAELSVCVIQFYMCRKVIPMKTYMINGFSFCSIGFIMLLAVRWIPILQMKPFVTIVVQMVAGAIVYTVLACVYMVRIERNPVLVNEVLNMLHIKYRF